MFCTKLGELGFPLIAGRLEENRDEVIQYLIKNGWTKTHMAGQQWYTGEVSGHFYYSYGKMTNNHLRNTKGIEISKYGVMIAHWAADGNATTPRIYCSADEFVIYE